MEQKKLFYIQLTNNFFKSENMLLIIDEAKARNLDVAHIELIYIKLILASLANDGLIRSQNGELTPQKVKALIEYSTGNYRNDLETINKSIELFEDLDLIIFDRKMNALFVKDSKLLTMSKTEDAQKKFIERRKNNELVNLIQSQNLTEDQKEDFLLHQKIKDEFIPGILYCSYISSADDPEEYKKVFVDLNEDNFTINEITTALRIFIKRSLDVDYRHVQDKKNYLKVTLLNIIMNEVRILPDIYSPIIKEMIERSLIEEEDGFNIMSIMKKYENKNYSKAEVYEASKIALAKASIESKKTKSQYINVFDRLLDDTLKSRDVSKKVIAIS